MSSATRDELIKELQQVKDELGEPPSANNMREYGEYPVSTYRYRFGSWANAVREAGFTARSVGESLPRKDLIAELKRLAEQLGQPPSATDMKTMGDYSTDAYRNHFGSWNNAVEAAGFDPTPQGGERLHTDELIEELSRLADDLGRAPKTSDMKEQGKYTLKPYYKRFESWKAALEAAEIAEIT